MLRMGFGNVPPGKSTVSSTERCTSSMIRVTLEVASVASCAIPRMSEPRRCFSGLRMVIYLSLRGNGQFQGYPLPIFGLDLFCF